MLPLLNFDRDYQLGETVDNTVKTKLENQLTELAEEKNVLSSRFESQKALVEEILSLRTKLSDSETEYTEERTSRIDRTITSEKSRI